MCTKKFFSFFLALSMMLSVFSVTASAQETQTMKKSKMQKYVEAMQPGWNLGNTFDALNSWGDPKIVQNAVTKDFIKEIKNQGFKSIRIPITWGEHMSAAPDYTIDPAFMDRIQQVVDWSLQEGLYVMINVHHDSWMWITNMATDHDAVLAQFNAIWTQIANRFKNHSDKLMFESINEQSFNNADKATQINLLNELNTNFFHVVRNTGGGNAIRPLVLPEIGTSPDKSYMDATLSLMKSLNDQNLIATIHYYGFWPFTSNIAGYTKFDSTSQNDIKTALDGAYDDFVANGIPVIMGEYGLFGWDSGPGTVEHGEELEFLSYLLQYSKSKGITNMLWDNTTKFNRTNYTWSDPDLHAYIMQSLIGNTSTADTDLVFLKSGTTVGDATINLNLVGNQFVSLKNGNTVLAPGKDYTINGSVLTIKASYLAKFATGAFGEKAVLTVGFNSGPAWQIHVKYNDTPVFSDVSGTTSNFAIPVSFNGDQLATMEAVYAAGGNAGPNNWTSYKAYNYDYAPDYTNNTITLKPNFFTYTNDGVVNLTFHFWSGAIVKYTITKSGTNVIGSAS